MADDESKIFSLRDAERLRVRGQPEHVTVTGGDEQIDAVVREAVHRRELVVADLLEEAGRRIQRACGALS